ncbi:hypothetical protein ACPCBC_09235 [Streptomyces incarnatus]|uniref:hypothetical protein n=1 Tax=unclassified Streptomyces TaxID=2593676 RepID=UPI00119F77EB|nr:MULTISPECIES: hypothetical protein [Streptomyces]QHC29184.1 hypothetical protein GR129_10450 [Streptomyces sp. HF10]WKE72016.1 hypothetical protein QHG49_24890 [Streptomyces sp. WP-1]
MSDHSPTAPYDVVLCVEQLRAALALHNIKLPSLSVHLPSFAGKYGRTQGLVTLGNCNMDMARALTVVLKKSAAEE